MREGGRAGARSAHVLDAPAPANARRRASAVTLAILLHGGIVVGVTTLSVRVLSRATHLQPEWMEVVLPAPPEAPEPTVVPAEPEPPPRPIAPEVPRPALKSAPAPAEPVVEEPRPSEPPPAAAEAGKVLEAPAEVVDIANTIVSGEGSYRGGTTESGGISKVAVRDGNARASGVPGGTGLRALAPPAPKNLSRPPMLAGGGRWDCPFPSEADVEDIHSAVVSLRVRVGKSGTVEAVEVTRDPGFGFGREARRCALRKKWQPGLDKNGQATEGVAIVNVRFGR